jgi:hypothetical protein
VAMDNPSARDAPFGETRAQVEKIISEAIREVETAADDEAAFRQVSWLVETLRVATNTTASLRLTIVSRIQKAGGLSLAKLGEKIGVSKARAAEMMQAAKQKDKP